jgi:hypothetical protein
MYEQIADKITKFVLATLNETLRGTALNGKSRTKNNTSSRLSKRATKNALAKEIKKLRPRWFGEIGSLEAVVQKMLVASMSPAHKAHATRALNNYSKKRAAEIGSTPKRVVAGVKAAVTKRIKSKGSNTCSTN